SYPDVRPLLAHHRQEHHRKALRPRLAVHCDMAINADKLKNLVERELQNLSDIRVLSHIRGLLVEPNAVLLHWDYGVPGQQYPCWIVLADPKSNTAVAYSEQGFGPRNPWGLVWLPTDDEHSSMGMDSGWFPSLLGAYFESSAADLSIWRVFKTDASGAREPLT